MTNRKHRNRNPHGTTSRLSDEQLRVMGKMFPGFDTWYVRTHDEQGKVLPGSLMPGLTQQQYEGDQNKPE